MMRTKKLLPTALLALCALPLAADELLFTFGGTTPVKGAAAVSPSDVFSEGKGYGFLDEGGRRFAVELEEGNYDVAVRLGSGTDATETTVKAEARRLMLLGVETEHGEMLTRTFTVNVRRPEYGGGKVGLTGREQGPPLSPSWDGMLSLEFNGIHPGVSALKITPNPEAVTVFLAGDSTVTDQANEPWAGWGQMLPAFFDVGIAVSNHAESGLSLRSFEYQGRLKKVLSMMKKGDYLFIQFGHNDQKDKSEGAGPFTTYKAKLVEFVKAVRAKGGIPVLVTSMERRRWSGGKPQATLGDFAEAVRQVGSELEVPVIDLNAMSLETYAALGESGSKKAFVHFPANTFPGQDSALKDDTHHSGYGGYLLACCVAQGIRDELPELAVHFREGTGKYTPSRPAINEAESIPPSPVMEAPEKPAGD